MATKINKLDDSNVQSQNSSSSVSKNSLPVSPTNNLDISSATYLGGSQDDSTDAVDISADGKFVIVGGSLKDTNLGVKETELLGGGDGTIVRYDPQTNKPISKTNLPGRVIDAEVSKNGDIAVAFEGGVAVLNSDATKVKWSKSLSNVDRVAISDSGKVGVVRNIKGGDRAYLFDSEGEQLKEWKTNSSKRHFQDIAVSDQNGGMVFATGYEQKTSILQVAFTQAWSYQGENLWKNYDFDDEDIYEENLLADTRGQRVSIGRDGNLYSSYFVNGGTGFSIFYRDPYSLSEKVGSDRKIETDLYNSPTNVNSVKMTWYGRYDLETGELIKGQSLLGRLANGKGNSVDVDSITATEDGTVILGGSAAARIANRDEQTIEGKPVKDYVAFDGFVAVISPDLQERLSWTPISDSQGTVAAFRDGKTAVVTTTDFKGSQITHNAIQNSPGGKDDGYLLVIGGNDAPPTTTPPDDTPKPDNYISLDLVESYGGSQDRPNKGTVEISSNNELKLSGNRWQKLEINSKITDDTVLGFEFASIGNGEIQGIGFDNNSAIGGRDNERFFQVDGKQNWGIKNLDKFIVGKSGDKDIYEIPVGEFFTGDFKYLTFSNDDDRTKPNSESIYSKIKIFENTSFENTSDTVDISINGATESKEVLSYGGKNQNKNIISTVDNDNKLELAGNGWRRLDITGYEITDDTILKFDFAGNGEAEIQGIGFDNNNAIDNRVDSKKLFQVDGSQSWGIEELDDYILGSKDGFTQYSINVGEFFTGEFNFLTISNDHDVTNSTAVGQFQNIELIG